MRERREESSFDVVDIRLSSRVVLFLSSSLAVIGLVFALDQGDMEQPISEELLKMYQDSQVECAAAGTSAADETSQGTFDGFECVGAPRDC